MLKATVSLITHGLMWHSCKGRDPVLLCTVSIGRSDAFCSSATIG